MTEHLLAYRKLGARDARFLSFLLNYSSFVVVQFLFPIQCQGKCEERLKWQLQNNNNNKKNNNPQESNIMIPAQSPRAPWGWSFRSPTLLRSSTKETICFPHLALYLPVLTLKLNSDKNGHKGERVSRNQFAAVLMRTACSWKPEITQFVRALSHSCLHNEVRKKKPRSFICYQQKSLKEMHHLEVA